MVGRVLTILLHALGVFLFFIGAASLVRRLGRRNPKILLYHDCSDRETEYTADLDCTTTPALFREHIEYLKRHYDIVDLDSLLGGDVPDRAVAITFDDGYASVYDNAYPILSAARAPATVYLISDVVENATLVWVNELNALLRRGGRPATECAARHFEFSNLAKVSEIIDFCRLHYRPEKMSSLLHELRTMLGSPVSEHAAAARLYLTWEQIEAMRSGGITFGNHTRSHPNLECLTEQEQDEEIRSAQSSLLRKLPAVTSLAYPFGHKGARTAQLASENGLRSVAEVGGYNRPLARLSLGRTHLSGHSVAGLFSRMEVVEPIKGLLRQRLQRSTAAAT